MCFQVLPPQPNQPPPPAQTPETPPHLSEPPVLFDPRAVQEPEPRLLKGVGPKPSRRNPTSLATQRQHTCFHSRFRRKRQYASANTEGPPPSKAVMGLEKFCSISSLGVNVHPGGQSPEDLTSSQHANPAPSFRGDYPASFPSPSHLSPLGRGVGGMSAVGGWFFFR